MNSVFFNEAQQQTKKIIAQNEQVYLSSLLLVSAGSFKSANDSNTFPLECALYQRQFTYRAGTTDNAFFKDIDRVTENDDGTVKLPTVPDFGEVIVTRTGPYHDIRTVTEGHHRVLKTCIYLAALKNECPEALNADDITGLLYLDKHEQRTRLVIRDAGDRRAYNKVLRNEVCSGDKSPVTEMYDSCVHRIRTLTKDMTVDEVSDWVHEQLMRLASCKVTVHDIGEATENNENEFNEFCSVNSAPKEPFKNLEHLGAYLMIGLNHTAPDRQQHLHDTFWDKIIENTKKYHNGKSCVQLQNTFLKSFLLIVYEQDRPTIPGKARVCINQNDYDTNLVTLFQYYVENLYSEDHSFTTEQSKIAVLKQLSEYAECFAEVMNLDQHKPNKEFVCLSALRSNDGITPADVVAMQMLWLHRASYIDAREFNNGLNLLMDLQARSYLKGASGLSTQTVGIFIKKVTTAAIQAHEVCSALNALFSHYVNDVKDKTRFLSDEEVLRILKNDQMDTPARSKVVKYLMLKLILDCEPRFDLTTLANPDTRTLEHICSQDLSKLNVSDEKYRSLQEHKRMLGNLTIIDRRLNASLGNNPFENKKIGYRNDKLPINRNIWTSPKWEVDEIIARTNHLASRIRELHLLSLQ